MSGPTEHSDPSESYIIFVQEDCRLFFKGYDLGLHFHAHLFIHLASVVGGRIKIEDEPFSIADDLSIDTAAFQWAMKVQPDDMIYFSSSAAYPVAYQQQRGDLGNATPPILLDETMISLRNDNDNIKSFGIPDLTYGWSKLTGEYLAEQLRSHSSVRVAVYRPFSGYGEDQDDSYPFPAILKRILHQKISLMNSASSITPTQDTDSHVEIELWSNATRDFVYIEDIVSCVLSTFNELANRANEFQAMNLASGVGTSFEMLARKMVSAAHLVTQNVTLGFRFHQDKPQGVDFRVGDNKIAQHFGCSFSTSLDDGIAIALDYLRPQLLTEANGLKSPSKKVTQLESKYFSRSDNVMLTASGANSDKSRPSARKLKQLSPKYSSHHCVGSSQGLFNMSIQHSAKDFPLSSHADYRICHLKHVCLSEGKLLYFRDPDLVTVSDQFFPLALNSSHEGSMFYPATYFVNSHLMEVRMMTHQSFPEHSQRRIGGKIAAIGGTSASYNYGHYIFDDVVPSFSAARIFNLPIEDLLQVVSSECDSVLDIPLYGIGPLTGRHACLNRYNSMWPYFFNSAPLFLSREKTLCFDNAIAGQNSALSLRSLQLTRATELREFRDFVINRNVERTYGRWNFERTNTSLNVLVYTKGFGWWDNDLDVCLLVKSHLSFSKAANSRYRRCNDSIQVAQACNATDNAISGDANQPLCSCNSDVSAVITHQKLFRIHRLRPFQVDCKNTDEMSFEEEVVAARSSHIIISIHGTTQYVSLFAQTTTYQIVLSPQQPVPHHEAKENHIQMYLTHVKPYYLPYEALDSSFKSTLLLAATEAIRQS